MLRPSSEQPFNPKHRITGAVILIAVAIILVTALLDEPEPPTGSFDEPDVSEVSGKPFESRIVTPTESDAPVEAPSPTAPLADVESPPDSPADRETTGRPEFRPVLQQDHSLPPPRLNTVDPDEGSASATVRVESMGEREEISEAGGRSWILQVASLAEKDNADEIAARLEQSGYRVSSSTIEVNGESMIRVRVGPFAERVEAFRAKTGISEAFGLNGFVFRRD